MGSPLDKRGSITLDTLKVGEYVLGYYDVSVSTSSIQQNSDKHLIITPNPASHEFTIEVNLEQGDSGLVNIMNLNGKMINKLLVNYRQNLYKIDSRKFKNGEYILQLTTSKGLISSKKILIQK
mgnify:FL=1